MKLKNIERINYSNILENCDLFIDWWVTKNCNWNCSYCLFHCRNTNKFNTLSDTKTACNYYNSISTITSWLSLFGGEPLTFPYIESIFDLYNYNIRIYTNLYKDKYYLKQLAISCKGKLKFVVSFHPARTNLVRLTEKIELLLSHNCIVQVKCMFTGQDDDYSYNSFIYLNSIKDDNFSVVPRTIYTNIYGSELKWYLSDSFLKARNIAGKDLLFKLTYDTKTEIWDKYDMQFFDTEINDYKLYNHIICNAGKNYLSIAENYDVYPCCRYNEEYYKQPPIGNVITNPPKLKRTICKLPFCFPPEEDFLLKRIVL